MYNLSIDTDVEPKAMINLKCLPGIYIDIIIYLLKKAIAFLTNNTCIDSIICMFK